MLAVAQTSPRPWAWTRPRARASTTWRCCGSWAARPTRRRRRRWRAATTWRSTRGSRRSSTPGPARASGSSSATWPRTCRGRRRIGLVARALADPGGERRSLSGHCEAASRLATRLGMPARCATRSRTPTSAGTARGTRTGWRATRYRSPVRVVTVARDAELWARQAGWSAVAEVLAHRRGRAYDPTVVDALDVGGRAVAGRRSTTTPWAAVLDAEPDPVAHHRGGAARRRTGRRRRLRRPQVAVPLGPLDGRGRPGGGRGRRRRSLRRRRRDAAPGRAGARRRPRRRSLRDLGPAGPLSADQWERVRLHPYLGERVLARCDLLRAVRRAGRPPPRATRRLRLPPRPRGDQLDARRPAARRSRQLRRHGRRPSSPARCSPRATPRRSCSTRSTPAGWAAEVDAVLAAAGRRPPPAAGHPAGRAHRA